MSPRWDGAPTYAEITTIEAQYDAERRTLVLVAWVGDDPYRTTVRDVEPGRVNAHVAEMAAMYRDLGLVVR